MTRILLKSDQFPTYHLANVVDDHLMELHMLFAEMSGYLQHPNTFTFTRRLADSTNLHAYAPAPRTDGKNFPSDEIPPRFSTTGTRVFAEAFINFLSLMGYSMPGDRNIPYPRHHKRIRCEAIGISGAIFDVQKLEWLNQQYLINTIPEDKLLDRLKEWNFSDGYLQKLMPLVHTRIKTFGDLWSYVISSLLITSITPSSFSLSKNFPYSGLRHYPGYNLAVRC